MPIPIYTDLPAIGRYQLIILAYCRYVGMAPENFTECSRYDTDFWPGVIPLSALMKHAVLLAVLKSV